ncbi:orotidine-5'-phosphate decarboxylase [Roseiflexus sp.]|uniref:orotidine-5'-phosphate decarboxylase n=1 Tax=Roseiflexus sp. TaxID=2562120 RepID=UPI0021DDC344|nr:orotidine-5'-phosphate decarboxylase [Roseiflexus sp.]GIV98754.1 MAG: orotidine 5'-phosphate decarboxylase [Roseiflexus sp.]
MNFFESLDTAARRNQSRLCIGLDPEPARMPDCLPKDAEGIYTFCAAIMDATVDLVCAYKPNVAFFEAHGAAGWSALERLVKRRPGPPLILDAKRGDIGSTAEAYARSVFTTLGADAVTLSPYLGSDALEPFLRHADRGCFILCKTSNPGSGDLQDARLADGRPLYLAVAEMARDCWNTRGNVGLVVGATHPAALADIRRACPDMLILAPGVGAQGGDLETTVRAAAAGDDPRLIVNVSRTVLYADRGANFAAAARTAARQLRDAINAALRAV